MKNTFLQKGQINDYAMLVHPTPVRHIMAMENAKTQPCTRKEFCNSRLQFPEKISSKCKGQKW
ncbi:MAG TPA: hypothetical protein VGN63_05110 [Flavisolibacter sp.]|nr:hypothetical protein [Flavisolibacter sp.]